MSADGEGDAPREDEFATGRVVRRDFAWGLAAPALAAFSVVAFLAGCAFLFSFFVHLLLGMPVDDPCCTSILNCNCPRASGLHLPHLFVALAAFFVGLAPWVGLYLHRRSEASESQ